jgi:hypothetical protein
MSFPADTYLERPAIVRLLLAFLAIQLMVVWIRTPYLPAASAGDEIWTTEAGLFFNQQGGGLRAPMVADDMGSSIKFMYPPLVCLGQALSLRIFGLNEFGMMALSSMGYTLTIIVLFLLLRQLKAPVGLSLLTCCALLGPFIIERDLLHVRPEALIPPLFLLFMLSWLKGQDCVRGGLFSSMAGLLVGLSCIAYYPQAPFILAAAMVVTAPKGFRQAKNFLCFLAGGAVILTGFLIWVNPDWGYFYKQVIAIGHDYYGPWKGAAGLSVVSEASGSTNMTRLGMVLWGEYGICLVVAVGCSVLYWRQNSVWLRLGLGAVICLGPPLLYQYPGRAVTGGMLCLLLIAGAVFQRTMNLTIRKVGLGILIALSAVGTAKAGFMVAVGVYEHGARSDAPIEKLINEVVKEPGKIGFSERAWLALRKIRPSAEDLHFFPNPEDPQAYAERSLILRSSEHLNEFAYFVVETDRLPALRSAYPILEAALAEGKFVQIGRVNSSVADMSITMSSPYDLTIFGRSKSSSR